MNYFYWAAVALSLQLAACSTVTTQPSDAQPTASPEKITEVSEAAAEEIPSRPFPADSFHDLLVAEFAVKRNRYDLALGNYLQQAHRTQDSGVTARATRLAQFLGADKASLDASLLWVELEPDNLEAHFTAANMLAKQQRPLEAQRHMTMVLNRGGKTNFAAIAASTLNASETIRTELEANTDQLIVQHPNEPQLLTAKALLLQQRGATEQALATIRQVLETNNQDLHAVIVEARLLQKLDRGEEAFSRLGKVVEAHPRNRRLRLQYARMLMSKNINLAKQQFEILLNQSPNDPDLLLSLALISKETQQLDDAVAYFQQLLEINTRTTQAHYYLGLIAEQRRQLQQAIEHYQQIPPGSDFLAATSRIITIYLQQGRAETAQLYLQSLRQDYPEHGVRMYLLEAEVLLNGNRFNEGQALLTEALLIHPQQASLLYTRSIFSEKLNHIELMKQDLQDIISLDPNNPSALNALGYMLANHNEQLEQAFEYVSQALRIKPGDPAIMDSLGWIEYRRGNLQQALEILQEAYKAFPDHEVAAHLGEVLWVLGQQAKAQQLWQEALQKTPDSTIVQETIQRLTAPKIK